MMVGASITASMIALYLVPILELAVNIPIIEAALMLLVSLILFPYEGLCGHYNSTFILQFFICGLTIIEAMRIYSFMPTTISSSVLMVSLTGYLSKKISVWLLNIISSTSRSQVFKKIWNSCLMGCKVVDKAQADKSKKFAKGMINLYLLSASHMVIGGMLLVGFFMIFSVGFFRSTIVAEPTHHARMAASIHGALHSINTLCDLEVSGELTSTELDDALDALRNKLYDHSFLILEKVKCTSGTWEWDEKSSTTPGFSRENRKVDFKDTTAWVTGISNEKYEAYLFHIIASLVCLVFFVVLILLGADSLQKSIGKGVTDTLNHLSRYDNTINTSTPPFYSVLHHDSHYHESWWACFTRNALWHGSNILNHATKNSSHCCGSKQVEKSDEPVNKMVVESLDLEVAADHLIHLYQMKRDHHDVRRNGNIDRGQFVEASVSDWISSVFKQPELSVATAEPLTPPPQMAHTPVKRTTQTASKLPPINALHVSKSYKKEGSASDSFDGSFHSPEYWKVDGTKLDELLDRMRSRDVARARNAQINRHRQRTRNTHEYEGGSFHPPGEDSAPNIDGLLAGGRALRDRRVFSAPQIKTPPIVHHSHDRISSAGHWPIQRNMENKNDSAGESESRSSLMRSETETEENADMLKITSLDAEKQISSHHSDGTDVVVFENGWEDTFGGERIGKTTLGIDIPTPYHISLDSIKLDVLKLNMPQLKSLITEVLKTSAPLPAPVPTSPNQPPKMRKSHRKSLTQHHNSFKRRVAAVVCEETLSPKVIAEFVSRVLDGYHQSNPYHNAAHGADVCHTVWRFQRIIGGHYLFTPVELFAQLVAALGHDLGHPGLNNNYLVSNYHPLAMSYHDESPLENMHCYELFRIIHSFGGECDVFRGLGVHGRAESREIVVKCILSTDMAFHSSQVTKLGELVSRVTGPAYAAVLADLPRHSRFGAHPHPALSFLDDVETRRSVLEVLVHTSDINNPLKPRSMAIAWTDRVVEEFHAQGDRERAENVPISPMCDRSRLDLPSMQLGFMDFVVAPLVSKVTALFPSLVQHAFYLVGNYSRFARLKEADLLRAAAEAEASENLPSPMHRQLSDNTKSGSLHDKPTVPPAVENLRNKRKDLSLGFFNNAYPPLTPAPLPDFQCSDIVKSEVMASSMIGRGKELKRTNSWSAGRRGSIETDMESVIGIEGMSAAATRTKKITRLLRILISLGGPRRDSTGSVATR